MGICGSSFAEQDADKRNMILSRAAALGEPEAMCLLSCRLQYGNNCVFNMPRAKQLMLESAQMGFAQAQYLYSMSLCDVASVECFAWLRRSALQGQQGPFDVLVGCVKEELEKFDKGASGRVLFEIGAAYAARPDSGTERERTSSATPTGLQGFI